MLQEFKKFAIKGNVVDMAVGIIIGAAFGKIVSSLVADIIMPPIGVLLGGVDFSSLSITLKKAADGAAAITINYGLFINTIIDFVIISFAIFILVKQINRFKKKEEDKVNAEGGEGALGQKPKETSEDILLLREIRDSLKK